MLLGAWDFLKGKMRWVILVIVLLAIPLGYFVQYVEPDTSLETQVRKGSSDYNLLMEIKENFSDQSIMVFVRGKTINDVMSDQNLDAMRYVTDHAQNHPQVGEKIRFTLSPALLLDYMSNMGMYNPEKMTPEDLILLPDGSINPQFKDLFMMAPPEKFDDPDWQRYTYIDENGQRQAYYHGAIIIGMWDSWDNDELTEFIDDLKDSVDEAGFDQNVWTLTAGLPVMMNWVANETPKVLGELMVIGAILMLLLLTFGFRVLGRRPRRWLVVVLILLSIVYTLGICGMLSIKLGNVSVVAFPILLGMSVDSCVQTHSRYDEEIRKGKTADEAAKTAIRRVVKALWFGMTLQMIGFASVLMVNNQQIIDFGIMLIIGCAICMVVMLMFLLGILYKMDKGGDATREQRPLHAGPVERLFGWMTPGLAKFAIPLILIGVIASGLGWWADDHLKLGSGMDKLAAHDVQTWQDTDYLMVLAGGILPWNVVVKVDEDHSVLDPELLEWAHEKSLHVMEVASPEKGHYIGAYSNIGSFLAENLGSIPPTAEAAESTVTTFLPRDIWISMISEDRKVMNLTFFNTDVETDSCTDSWNILNGIFTGPNTDRPEFVASVTVTGLAILGPVMDDAMMEGRDAIATVGVGGMLLFCFLLFRFNWKRTIAAAFPVLMVLGWSSGYMWLQGLTANMLTAMLPVQMMAIGIELTIILLMRYYEERDKGEHPMLAMTTALSRIGRAIMISGGVIFAGFFSMMFAFDLPAIQEFAYITMMDTILVAIAVLVVMPALVLKFDLRSGKGKVTDPVPDVEKLVSSPDESVEDLTA